MKKILLTSTTLLLAAAPSVVAVSCGEEMKPMQEWSALSDGFLNVTMEDLYTPYNFRISAEKYALIEDQSRKTMDVTPGDGMGPLEARNWMKMILPIDTSHVTITHPYVGGIDPYMSRVLAQKMSTSAQTITPKVHIEDWDVIVEGWKPNSTFDMVISAMAPDSDKVPMHAFTNEYLLTENVIARWYSTPSFEQRTITNWKKLTYAEKEAIGPIAVEDFPESDPTGKNNTAVKYFGAEWVVEAGDMEELYEHIARGDYKYAFIEDIQGEEFKQKSRGNFDYHKNLFPAEPKIKSAMSVKPGTPSFVLKHINDYLTEVANLDEQAWMKDNSIKLSAYISK